MLRIWLVSYSDGGNKGPRALSKELFFQLAQGCADAGDLPDAINFGNELANLDFSYRDIGQLLDEWQTHLEEDHNT